MQSAELEEATPEQHAWQSEWHPDPFLPELQFELQ